MNKKLNETVGQKFEWAMKQWITEEMEELLRAERQAMAKWLRTHEEKQFSWATEKWFSRFNGIVEADVATLERGEAPWREK